VRDENSYSKYGIERLILYAFVQSVWPINHQLPK
jgi:hypothetical protein